MLVRLVNELIAQKGHAYVWGDALPRLHEAFLLLLKLECALTAKPRWWHDSEYKSFYFRVDPSATVETPEKCGVNFASLANNHICNLGTEGLRETLEVMGEACIAHAGAAQRPVRPVPGESGASAVTALELVPVRIGEVQVNLARRPQCDWFIQKRSRLYEEIATKLAMGPERPSILLTAS